MKKQCSKCKQTKDSNEFHRDKSTKDGLKCWCKKCCAACQKTKKGKEAARRADIKYYKTKKGKEAITKYQNSKKGKEVRRRAEKKYTKNHPYRIWAKNTLNKHRRRGNITNISTNELEELAKQTTHCKICGCKLNWKSDNKNGTIQSNSPTLDRIDNKNTITTNNIQILCYTCNASKRNRTMSEFINYCEMVVKKFKN
jgi:hypothetical protein